MALEVVKKWRAQSPPGRFLKVDDKTGLWNDVGDKKAREKTSQALREKAPLIRKELEKEAASGFAAGSGDEDHNQERIRKTTFNVPEGGGVPKDRKDLNHLMLARDHSLGRDYLQPGEAVDVGDFDWTEPVDQMEQIPPPPPAPSGSQPHPTNPHHREDSAGAGWGSGQFAFIEPPSTNSSKRSSPRSPVPPPRDRSGSASSAYDSSRYPPPPPLPGGDVPQTSGSFPPPPPPPPHAGYPYPPGAASFPPPPPGPGAPRDHSLAGYPLHDASTSSAASRGSFQASVDVRSKSYDEAAAWQQGHPPPPPYGDYGPPPPYGYPPPPPPHYQQSPSGGSRMPAYSPHPSGYPYQSPSHSYGYPPDRSAFARTSGRDSNASSPDRSDIPPPPMPPPQWSGEPGDYQRVAEIIGQDDQQAKAQGGEHGYKRTHSTRSDRSDGNEKSGNGLAKPTGGHRRKLSGDGEIPSPPDGNFANRELQMQKPQVVKRDTSHQCENEETKRRVQRSRLARDHSLAGVNLQGGDVAHKALDPREYAFSDPSSAAASEKSSDGDAAVRALSVSMRQSSIAGSPGDKQVSAQQPQPQATKPATLSKEQRLTTVDAMRMAFADDDNDVVGDAGTEGFNGAPAEKDKCNVDPNGDAPTTSKPNPLTTMDRITTSDALSFNLENGSSILEVSKKPLPLSGDGRITTGNTVENILASVAVGQIEESVGIGTVVDEMEKPLSVMLDSRSTTVDEVLAPAGADDIANEWLVKDAGLK